MPELIVAEKIDGSAATGPVGRHASAAGARAMPPMTWNGSLVSASKTQTHYLHLSAFPCEKCSGPVIAGSLGTRRDDISQETDIRNVGAVCIACGLRPEKILELSVEHRFRPVEWKLAIQEHSQPAGPGTEQLPSELADGAKP
jgi:hypothetical protein